MQECSAGDRWHDLGGSQCQRIQQGHNVFIGSRLQLHCDLMLHIGPACNKGSKAG